MQGWASIPVRLCYEQYMFKFFHCAPYAVCVELKNVYLFVFCFGGLLFVGVATYGSLCGGESRDVWVVFGLECRE